MNKQLAALAAALILAAPIAANAQDVPSYAAAAPADQQIQGRIAAFDGGYNLQVSDANGYVDNVQLHDGTIINPTGLTLAPGMVVSILGFNAGPSFDANEIDTPYTFDAGVPFYAGHRWDYYGSAIDLDFFFGSGSWWHGGGGDSNVRVANVREPAIGRSAVPVAHPQPVFRSEPVLRSEPIVRSEPVVRSAPIIRSEPVERAEPVVRSAPVERAEPVAHDEAPRDAAGGTHDRH